jgi:hypothetical protein
MSRKASSVNRDQFLARTYDHLRDTKTRLNRQAGSELRAERDADRGDGLDSSDRASEECDRELSSRLSERLSGSPKRNMGSARIAVSKSWKRVSR